MEVLFDRVGLHSKTLELKQFTRIIIGNPHWELRCKKAYAKTNNMHHQRCNPIAVFSQENSTIVLSWCAYRLQTAAERLILSTVHPILRSHPALQVLPPTPPSLKRAPEIPETEVACNLHKNTCMMTPLAPLSTTPVLVHPLDP